MGLFASPEDQLKKKEAQLRILEINNRIDKTKAANKKIKKGEYDRDLQRLTA